MKLVCLKVAITVLSVPFGNCSTYHGNYFVKTSDELHVSSFSAQLWVYYSQWGIEFGIISLWEGVYLLVSGFGSGMELLAGPKISAV